MTAEASTLGRLEQAGQRSGVSPPAGSLAGLGTPLGLAPLGAKDGHGGEVTLDLGNKVFSSRAPHEDSVRQLSHGTLTPGSRAEARMCGPPLRDVRATD